MTYSPPDGVARRASHGDDVHAGYSPWPRVFRIVLPDSPGVHVVHFRQFDHIVKLATYAPGVKFWL